MSPWEHHDITVGRGPLVASNCLRLYYFFLLSLSCLGVSLVKVKLKVKSKKYTRCPFCFVLQLSKSLCWQLIGSDTVGWAGSHLGQIKQTNWTHANKKNATFQGDCIYHTILYLPVAQLILWLNLPPREAPFIPLCMCVCHRLFTLWLSVMLSQPGTIFLNLSPVLFFRSSLQPSSNSQEGGNLTGCLLCPLWHQKGPWPSRRSIDFCYFWKMFIKIIDGDCYHSIWDRLA